MFGKTRMFESRPIDNGFLAEKQRTRRPVESDSTMFCVGFSVAGIAHASSPSKLTLAPTLERVVTDVRVVTFRLFSREVLCKDQ